jgi:hypothetical protein
MVCKEEGKERYDKVQKKNKQKEMKQTHPPTETKRRNVKKWNR